MKKSLVLTCMLLFAIGLMAAPIEPAKDSCYWVAESGPRSNPYTVIRLYDKKGKQFLEILMSGYRLKVNGTAIIKRLNTLANADNAADAASIATLLRFKACRISSVKKVTESCTVKI